MSPVEISRHRPVIEERVPPKEMLAEPATVIVLQALVPGDVGETLGCTWPSVTKFDSESALRHHESALRHTLRTVRLIGFVEVCIGKAGCPTPLAFLLPLCNAEGSDEMASRQSRSRASNGSSQHGGIDHEITNFHPVVSHLAGTPPVDRVPFDSICALGHALDRSPHEAWSNAPPR